MIGENKERINLVIGEIAAFALFFLSILAFGNHLLGADLIPFLKWWGALLCLGFAFIPLTTIIFKSENLFCVSGEIKDYALKSALLFTFLPAALITLYLASFVLRRLPQLHLFAPVLRISP